MNRIIPTQKQLEFLDWEFGAFFHFGIRTFYEGHKDWDMQDMPLNGFCPENLDCDSWIKTVKDAGMKYAILVCKHHDGFTNWPSKHTDYSVANTPWKNGKGDVVAEFTAACQKYDIKVGLYYSPAEFGSSKKNALEYDNYFIDQISELLSNYGTVDYLWFDGCGSEGHKYDTDRIVKSIRSLQPNILIFNMWNPDTRWVGNEAGIAPSPCYNTVNSTDFSVLTAEKTVLDNAVFLPAECDCRSRFENWFFSESDEDTVKTLDELLGLYYYSVGRGGNLLINIAPNKQGLLPKADTDNIIALGNEVKRRFSNPIPATRSIDDNNKSIYRLKFNTEHLVNHVVISEDLSCGEFVKSFGIYIKSRFIGEPLLISQHTNIGHKAICTFPTVSANEIIIKLDCDDNMPEVKMLQAFYIK